MHFESFKNNLFQDNMFIIATYLLFIVLVPNLAISQINTSVTETEIDGIFSEWDQEGSPGCAVAIYDKDRILFQKGYGTANLEDGTSITPQTVFYIGSVSKQFAAAAIALLTVRGELDLDKPVRHYLPEMPVFDVEPTVRHLVHHTSGIPDLYALLALYDIDLEGVVPFRKMIDIITMQKHLNFEPGSKYLYSNAGYTLLAEIIHRVSGKSLKEYTTQEIFQPLGMGNTHFHDDRNHKFDHRALSYQPSNDGFELSYLYNFEGVGPGGLYSTLGDLLKWNLQLEENKLPDAEGFNDLMRSQGVLSNGETLDYAFALVLNRYKGLIKEGHAGSFMGFRAHFQRFPEYKFATSVLCNLGNINPANLSDRIADLYLEKNIHTYLEDYAGVYYSPDLGKEYTIETDGASLRLAGEYSFSGQLQFVREDVFRNGSWQFSFRKNSEDKTEGVVVDAGRIENLFLVKKE